MKMSLEKRLFRRRRITSNGCWIWLGMLRNGYGLICYQGKLQSVHRLSLKLFKPDEYSDSLQVNHKRECPDKSCFNPDHLYAGTQSENNLDQVALRTHINARKTHCIRGHEFTPENTYIYQGRRQCRICHRISNLIHQLGGYAINGKTA